jgi:hypothetical protein
LNQLVFSLPLPQSGAEKDIKEVLNIPVETIFNDGKEDKQSNQRIKNQVFSLPFPF